MTAPHRIGLNARVIFWGSAAFWIAVTLSGPSLFGSSGTSVAFAQSESGKGRGGSGGYHGGGSHGTASTTHGKLSGTEGSSGASQSTTGSTTRGQRGGTTDQTSSEGQGGRGGGGSARSSTTQNSGGRPVWAEKGIPEVELGRLNVARAPAQVLTHAFSEVTATWPTMGSTMITLNDGRTMTVSQLYSLPASQFAQVVQTNYAAIKRIDSPLENLSLLKDLASNNKTVLTGVSPASNTDLEAIFLGSASDKTTPITADTVTAIYTILGLPALSPAQTATLAAEADAVRIAINLGHGD